VTIGRCMTIQALKYGNRLHYEWNTVLLEQTETYILVLGEFGRTLKHYTRGVTFEINNWSLEYFSFEEWFTVSCEVKDGKLRDYYCNINQPAAILDGKVTFVDVDLDYVKRDGVWKVIDEEEFEANAIKYQYPTGLIADARNGLIRLQQRVRNQQFPFDGLFERWVPIIQDQFINKKRK